MFLPTGDTPNPRNFTAWVNWTLIGINVAVYLLISLPLSQRGVDPDDPLLDEFIRVLLSRLPEGMDPRQALARISAYDLFIFKHGYKPGASEWSDLFSSMFMHAGFAHLAGNMLFLWIYGDNVEHRLGRLGYLLTYILTGIVATWTFSLFAGASMTPLVGASGAISGVLGIYFLLFPRNQVKVFVMFFPIFFNVILIPARWLLGLYVIVENLLPLIVGATGGVAHGAHLGGFLGGLVIAYIGEQYSWKWPWAGKLDRVRTGPSIEEEEPPPTPRQTSLVERLGTAIARKDIQGAFRLVRQAHRHQLAQLSPHECAVLAGWIEEAGYAVQAGRLLRGYIADNSNEPHLAELYLQLGLLRMRQDQLTSAYQHLLDALDAGPDPGTEARIRQALQQIEVYHRRR